MHIFSPIGKKYAYFSPMDLKYTKLQNKAENFSHAARTPSLESISVGEKV